MPLLVLEFDITTNLSEDYLEFIRSLLENSETRIIFLLERENSEQVEIKPKKLPFLNAGKTERTGG